MPAFFFTSFATPGLGQRCRRGARGVQVGCRVGAAGSAGGVQRVPWPAGSMTKVMPILKNLKGTYTRM